MASSAQDAPLVPNVSLATTRDHLAEVERKGVGRPAKYRAYQILMVAEKFRDLSPENLEGLRPEHVVAELDSAFKKGRGPAYATLLEEAKEIVRALQDLKQKA